MSLVVASPGLPEELPLQAREEQRLPLFVLELLVEGLVDLGGQAWDGLERDPYVID